MVFRRKKKNQQGLNCSKIHTGPHNAGVESAWCLEEKRKTSRDETGLKYTLVLIMLVLNQHGV